MLKYHVAVCDDEKSDLDGIVQSVQRYDCLLYTSPSPRDAHESRMPSSA